MSDQTPLDPFGLRQMANTATNTYEQRVGTHRPASTDAHLLARTILHAAATISHQLKRIADELAHIR